MIPAPTHPFALRYIIGRAQHYRAFKSMIARAAFVRTLPPDARDVRLFVIGGAP